MVGVKEETRVDATEVTKVRLVSRLNHTLVKTTNAKHILCAPSVFKTNAQQTKERTSHEARRWYSLLLILSVLATPSRTCS